MSEAVVVLSGNNASKLDEAIKGLGSAEIHLNCATEGPWFGIVLTNPKPSAAIVAEALRCDYGMTVTVCSTLEEGRAKLCQQQEKQLG